MHIHILGICGTFMGGIAALAKAAGHDVSGCDATVYPPMSTQLRKLGIDIHEGYDAAQLDTDPDCVVVGNVVSRGFEVVEAMLDRDMTYESGPQWLSKHVLCDKHVIAVAGTHGKTTTASMLAWILRSAAPRAEISTSPTDNSCARAPIVTLASSVGTRVSRPPSRTRTGKRMVAIRSAGSHPPTQLQVRHVARLVLIKPECTRAIRFNKRNLCLDNRVAGDH